MDHIDCFMGVLFCALLSLFLVLMFGFNEKTFDDDQPKKEKVELLEKKIEILEMELSWWKDRAMIKEEK